MSIETGSCSHTRELRGVFGVTFDVKSSYSEYLLLTFPPGKPDTLLLADVGNRDDGNEGIILAFGLR